MSTWQEQNKDKQREYQRRSREKNREKNREKERIRYNDNKEKWQQHYILNKESLLAQSKEYKKSDKYRRYAKQYMAQRLQDPSLKLAHNLRCRIRRAVVQISKSKSASMKALLGCSIDELRVHLESLFKEGMSWDNYGEWHIDHIKPVSSFDLSDYEQQRQCFHYTNIQPLWAIENLVKSDKF